MIISRYDTMRSDHELSWIAGVKEVGVVLGCPSRSRRTVRSTYGLVPRAGPMTLDIDLLKQEMAQARPHRGAGRSLLGMRRTADAARRAWTDAARLALEPGHVVPLRTSMVMGSGLEWSHWSIEHLPHHCVPTVW